MADVSICRLLTGVVGGTLLLLSAQTVGLEILTDVSWDTAVRTCSERGEKLYDTTDTSALNDVTSGSYWMGAKVQYSPWMWTATRTPLFVYVGELNTSRVTTSGRGSTVSYTILYDNQASRCYYECRHSNNHNVKPWYIGLQDSTCYCFTYFDLDQISTDSHTPGRCLGNFMENCGTNNTISIYKPEIVSDPYTTWSLNPHGICAYITTRTYFIVKDEANCMTQKGHICNCSNNELDNTCFHHTEKESWFSANSSCALKTLNENNVKSIRREIQLGPSYWIGLKRTKYISWVDRGDPVNTDITYNTSGCLVLEKEANGDISFHISNCSEQKSALCLTEPARSTTPSDTAGSTHLVTNRVPEPRDQSGVVVGVSVAVVVLLVIGTVLALFWMKRRRLSCFAEKPTPTRAESPSASSPPPDDDYLHPVPISLGEGHYETVGVVTSSPQNSTRTHPLSKNTSMPVCPETITMLANK